jgi:coenzyme F420-0:L-glutamate ligase / coenzyme F420-1:gamma-L-glutamate ligase
MSLEILPIEGLPEVRPGDDLGALLVPSLAANAASDGDIVAVTQKIVSKAEGRIAADADRDALIARESVGVVARRGDLVITRTRHGFVCANAGIDASNVDAGFLTLLPEDPDASAERLQKELCARFGLTRLGLVITDTFGRPWREGVVDVAIGCAGLDPLVDLRGTSDDRGRELETTVVARADAIAAASGLVMTKASRVPAALLRGLPPADRVRPARTMLRDPEADLFFASALETVVGLRPPAGFSDDPIPRDAVEEAAAAAIGAAEGVGLVAAESAATQRRLLAALGGDPGSFAAAPLLIVVCARDDDPLGVGSAIERLRLALRTRHVASAWRPIEDPDAVGRALALAGDWSPLAVVAAGRTAEGEPGWARPPSTDRLWWRD